MRSLLPLHPTRRELWEKLGATNRSNPPNKKLQAIDCFVICVRLLCFADCSSVCVTTVFSTIAQAASDSQAVVGEDPAYSSELVTLAVKQAESFAVGFICCCRKLKGNSIVHPTLCIPLIFIGVSRSFPCFVETL